MNVGVLALQGDFAAHAKAVEAALREVTGADAAPVRFVRRASDCDGLDGLVVPGGESTTLLKLLPGTGLEDAIRAHVERGAALLATCAGTILAARTVTHPEQRSLGILDVVVERSSYGRQVDSFVADAVVEEPSRDELGGAALPAVFIRAPRIREVGEQVEVLARHDGDPVLVRAGSVLAATFHPELTDDRRVHRLFVSQCIGASVTGSRDERRASA